jgi:mycoredoxin
VQRRMWMLVGGFGLALGAWEAWHGQPGSGLLTLLLLGGVAWWMSPWRARGGATHREVEGVPPENRGVVAYWRPGCPYCERLRHRLGADGRRRVTWVDIWQDPEAAAYVRSVNDGDETVPTVVVGGVPHTNPDPGAVLEALGR